MKTFDPIIASMYIVMVVLVLASFLCADKIQQNTNDESVSKRGKNTYDTTMNLFRNEGKHIRYTNNESVSIHSAPRYTAVENHAICFVVSRAQIMKTDM